MAYSLSFLGAEPVGYETMLSLSGLEEEEAARLILVLWALGGLMLTEGERPALAAKSMPAPLSAVEFPTVPFPQVTPSTPVPPANPPTVPEPIHTVPLDFSPMEPGTVPTPEPAAPPIEMQEDLLKMEEEAPRESSATRARRCLVKAKALLLQDRTAEAIRLLEESVRLDPDSEQAYDPWLLLGRHRLTNPAWSTRAIEALQAASRLKPKAGEPWALMGELYHRKGFKANARACFKKALELDPSVPVPADVNVKEEDGEPEGKGLLDRFKSMLGR
jgi:tetratricopeptide (TPR) repeat protein